MITIMMDFVKLEEPTSRGCFLEVTIVEKGIPISRSQVSDQTERKTVCLGRTKSFSVVQVASDHHFEWRRGGPVIRNIKLRSTVPLTEIPRVELK